MSHNLHLDGRWNANRSEFESDMGKKYDWVYVVDNFGYTKFDKSEHVEDKIIDMADFEPYETEINDNIQNEWHKVKVIGKIRQSFEDFERYIIVNNGIIEYGVHPSIIR